MQQYQHGSSRQESLGIRKALILFAKPRRPPSPLDTGIHLLTIPLLASAEQEPLQTTTPPLLIHSLISQDKEKENQERTKKPPLYRVVSKTGLEEVGGHRRSGSHRSAVPACTVQNVGKGTDTDSPQS